MTSGGGGHAFDVDGDLQLLLRRRAEDHAANGGDVRVVATPRHGQVVARYFGLSGPWAPPQVARRTSPGSYGDPLWAVWAERV